MNKESPFSAEYDISNSTEAKPSRREKISAPTSKEASDLIEESHYKLSKPRRNTIRARIIPQ